MGSFRLTKQSLQYQQEGRRQLGKPSRRLKNKNASKFKERFLKANLINVHNDDYNDDDTRDDYGAEMESRGHDEA